jgi:CRISPR type III-A-associated protein Csm2
MSDPQVPEVNETPQPAAEAPQAPVEAPQAAAAPAPAPVETPVQPAPEPKKSGPPAARPSGPPRGPAPKGAGPKGGPGGDRPERGGPNRGGPNRGGERGDRPQGPRPDRGERGDRPGGDRGRFDGPPEMDVEKLVNDSLYLDNQAHALVARLRDMDSGTRSQLRRLYSAVRRACRAQDSERQHQFVMLRARLAYTIARHSLRSLDPLERLLLQVTRKNDVRAYERFRDLFEAIVAYNE